jgi:hypothetical protein
MGEIQGPLGGRCVRGHRPIMESGKVLDIYASDQPLRLRQLPHHIPGLPLWVICFLPEKTAVRIRKDDAGTATRN